MRFYMYIHIYLKPERMVKLLKNYNAICSGLHLTVWIVYKTSSKAHLKAHIKMQLVMSERNHRATSRFTLRIKL